MSRSTKKVCAGGICTGSNHRWTKSEHRRERHIVKQILNVFLDDEKIPNPKKFQDPWTSPTDGKTVYWWPWYFKSDNYEEWKWELYLKYLRK